MFRELLDPLNPFEPWNVGRSMLRSVSWSWGWMDHLPSRRPPPRGPASGRSAGPRGRSVPVGRVPGPSPAAAGRSVPVGLPGVLLLEDLAARCPGAVLGFPVDQQPSRSPAAVVRLPSRSVGSASRSIRGPWAPLPQTTGRRAPGAARRLPVGSVSASIRCRYRAAGFGARSRVITGRGRSIRGPGAVVRMDRQPACRIAG